MQETVNKTFYAFSSKTVHGSLRDTPSSVEIKPRICYKTESLGVVSLGLRARDYLQLLRD